MFDKCTKIQNTKKIRILGQSTDIELRYCTIDQIEAVSFPMFPEDSKYSTGNILNIKCTNYL